MSLKITPQCSILVACCSLAMAASQTHAQSCAVAGCYEVGKGGGDCSSACRGFCAGTVVADSIPIDTAGPSCVGFNNHLYTFERGIARPGFLFVASSVAHQPEPIPAAMGGYARVQFDDVFFTGPAGATSVAVTMAMVVSAEFLGGTPDGQNWDVTLRLFSNQVGFSGRATPGQVVSVTANVNLDGGSPVSRSGREGFLATLGHRIIAAGTQVVQGTTSLRPALGCQVFSFSAPGFIANSVNAGIVNNRLSPGPACCPADFNLSGGISVQDIFDFLAAYFANDPAADFNGSGALSVQDIFDYLAAYFAG